MLQGLRCFFGYHNWTRIGSAPSVLIVTDRSDKIWSRENGQLNYVYPTTELDGFVLLVECRDCPAEQGYGEYGGDTKKRTAAYARTYIEGSPDGHITKAEG